MAGRPAWSARRKAARHLGRPGIGPVGASAPRRASDSVAIGQVPLGGRRGEAEGERRIARHRGVGGEGHLAGPDLDPRLDGLGRAIGGGPGSASEAARGGRSAASARGAARPRR